MKRAEQRFNFVTIEIFKEKDFAVENVNTKTKNVTYQKKDVEILLKRIEVKIPKNLHLGIRIQTGKEEKYSIDV